MPQPEPGSAQCRTPASFVIVHNVSKRHNIGTLARSAAAFGVKEVSGGGMMSVMGGEGDAQRTRQWNEVGD